MLRRLFRSFNTKGAGQGRRWFIPGPSFRALPADLDAESQKEHRDARTWLSRFSVNDLPKGLGDVTFSRSSGPGGQNVNKVNSKATLRVRAERFLPLIPNLMHPSVIASRYYAANSNSLVIQSDESRSQSSNMATCYKKLHLLLVEAGKKSIRNETSQVQIERVKSLQKKSNESRLREKKAHGNKKAARTRTGTGR